MAVDIICRHQMMTYSRGGGCGERWPLCALRPQLIRLRLSRCRPQTGPAVCDAILARSSPRPQCSPAPDISISEWGSLCVLLGRGDDKGRSLHKFERPRNRQLS